jgi:hypothetical protein
MNQAPPSRGGCVHAYIKVHIWTKQFHKRIAKLKAAARLTASIVTIKHALNPCLQNKKTVKSLITLLIACCTLAQTVLATTTNYYVATTGNNTNSGTLAKPFLTIQKAATVMGAGDTCYIRTGTYRETVVPPRSGTSGARITFAPYQGESVIVSGAEVLNLSWSVYSGSIYKATTTNSFTQLFVDGDMMNEARWPNAKVDRLTEIPRATVDSTTSNLKNLVDAALPSVTLTGAVVHVFTGTPGGEYVAYTRTITNYDTGTKTITWDTALSNTVQPGNPYYLFHSLSLLDIATEWYLDDSGNNLYLWTPDGASPASHIVEAKTRLSAFVITNRAYITVTGLYTFAAGIYTSAATNLIVDDCHLRYVQHFTTADGFNSGQDTKCTVSGSNSMWINSSIQFSSQNGLGVGSYNVVSNCVISDVDYFPGNYYSAIVANGANSQIIRNTLANSGRSLVLIKSAPVEMAYNDMGYGQQLTKDGGAIYNYHADGQGMSIHHNWVHHSQIGIYLDEASTNFFVYRNVCYDNSESGMRLNSPSISNGIYNNTLEWNGSSFLVYGSTQAGTEAINNLGDSTMMFCADATTNKNGWFPPVGADYVPQAGSGAIDAGDIIPGVTDGYLGAAPDIGAYETGDSYWTPGASFSAPLFPTPESTSPPSAPTGLTALGTNGPLVNLSWIAPAVPVSYYNIKRSTTSGGETTVATVVAGASYSDGNVSEGTTYYYKVSAVNSTGESGSSSEANAVPLALIKDDMYGGGIGFGGTWTTSVDTNYYMESKTVSSTTGDYAQFYFFGTGIEVYTKKANSLGMFDVYIDDMVNPAATNVDTYNASTLYQQMVYQITGLSSGRHQVRIKLSGHKNASSSGYYIGVDFFKVHNQQVASLPTAPSGLTATAGDTQVALSWTASSGATSYSVKRATVSGGTYTTITNVTATSYTNTALANGTMYYFVVSATNSPGESPNSAEVSARPTSFARPQVALVATANQFQVSWLPDHTGWRLQMQTNLIGTNWLTVPGATSTNWMAIPISNNSSFFRLVYP